MNSKEIVKTGICIAILLLLCSFFPLGFSQSNTLNDSVPHTVFGEYGTSSSCPHCPPVSEYLHTIYTSGQYSFYYVSLVADKNTKASQRCSELGISGVPDVHFDGGYRHVLGDHGGISDYTEAINASQLRDSYVPVHDIDIETSLGWMGDEKIKINVTIINNECCSGAIYNGRLRVFVTETVSRWNDQSGHPYHFGMLDYAFNEDIVVIHKSPVTMTTIWDGDKYGYDISPDNIMVMAVVYNSENGYVDDADSVAIYSTPNTTITAGPEGITNDTGVTFKWTGSDSNTPTEYLLYSYKMEPYEHNWSGWVSNTNITYHGLNEGEYNFSVKARNSNGMEDLHPAYHCFIVNLGIPPDVNITKPVKSLYLFNNQIQIPIPLVIGFVDIYANVSDVLDIEKTEFYVNGQLISTDYYTPYVCNTWHDMVFLKKCTITVTAYDVAGNSGSDAVIIWKIF